MSRYYEAMPYTEDDRVNASDAILDGTIETLMQIIGDDSLPISTSRQLFLTVLNLETLSSFKRGETLDNEDVTLKRTADDVTYLELLKLQVFDNTCQIVASCETLNVLLSDLLEGITGSTNLHKKQANLLASSLRIVKSIRQDGNILRNSL